MVRARGSSVPAKRARRTVTEVASKDPFEVVLAEDSKFNLQAKMVNIFGFSIL